MEAAMSITVVDETTSNAHNDDQLIGQEEEEARESGKERLTRVRPQMPWAAKREARYADGGIREADEGMRIPSFVETCPHVCDEIIPLNGGRFNVDHYLRVLRAKAETDVSVAMALTVRPL